MAEHLTPDICIVGGGPAGIAAAMAAAALDASVVLISRETMDAASLRGGAVPATAFLAAARQIARAGDVGAFGAAASLKVNFGKVLDQVDGIVERAARDGSAARLTALGIRVIVGAARFLNAREVGVADAGVTVAARRFVVATGSSPVLPPIPGLDGVACLTPANIFDLNTLPKRLLVLGADPYGIALAQAFRRLGSEVVVLTAETPFAGEDAECAAIVLAGLEAEGIMVRSGVTVASVKKVRARAMVTLAAADSGTPEETVEGTHIFVAAGRSANVAALDLDRAGVIFDERGIRTDRLQRTANKHVYAIGDVAGAPPGALPSCAVAAYQAGVAVRHALRRQSGRSAQKVFARVTPTDPALAHVGVTEEQARARRRRIRVLRWPFHENDRARAERQTSGHIKIVTDAGGTILGATIVGPHADELIALWVLAIGQGLKIHTIAGLVLPVPVLSDVGTRAAMTWFASRLTSSWPRRIIHTLRIFG